MELLSEGLVFGDSEVGVALVESVEDAQTDLLEQVYVVVVPTSQICVQIQDLLHENHEAVDVEL
jgi:hypothetical protein